MLTAASRGEISAATGDVAPYESPSGKRILERLHRWESQTVLDLGILSGVSIATLAGAGARVHVYDSITPLLADGIDASKVLRDQLAEIRLLPESVDMVLAWDLFELLNPEDRAWLLTCVRRWLSPKGWLSAMFHILPSDRVQRYRLHDTGAVSRGQLDAGSASRSVVQNSEITALFSDYQILHSALIRTQVREVLAQAPG